MSVDWDSLPEPDSIPPQGVMLRTIEEALALLDQWIVAYAELKGEYARLHRDYTKMKFRAECQETLAANFEVLLEHRDKL